MQPVNIRRIAIRTLKELAESTHETGEVRLQAAALLLEHTEGVGSHWMDMPEGELVKDSSGVSPALTSEVTEVSTEPPNFSTGEVEDKGKVARFLEGDTSVSDGPREEP